MHRHIDIPKMTEFTVEITSLPLGVESVKLNDHQLGIDQVIDDSHGAQLGLKSGDILLSINNQTLSGIKGINIEQLLQQQSLPFDATFQREFECGPDPFGSAPFGTAPFGTNSFGVSPLGSTSPRSPVSVQLSPSVPIDIDVEKHVLNSSTGSTMDKLDKFERLSSNYSGGDLEASMSRISLDVHIVSTPRNPTTLDDPADPQKPHQNDQIHQKQHTEQESLDTIALRSFGEVELFQSGDHEDIADQFASRRSTVRQMVHSEPYCTAGNDINGAKKTNLLLDSPLSLAATDSNGFVFLEDVDSGRSAIDTVVRYEDIDRFTKVLVHGFCRRIPRLREDHDDHSDSQSDKQSQQTVNELVSQYLFDNSVMFDISGQMKPSSNLPHSDCAHSHDVHLSSNGFQYGMHEWNIKVIEADSTLQQIGIIGSSDIDSLQMTSLETIPRFENVAQSLLTQSKSKLFYASYNANGSSRCVKDLSKKYPDGLKSGDVVTVRLNLTKGHPKVSYYLNKERVRKVMSLEQNKMYYPVIVCSENGVYELVDYQ